MDRVSVSLNAYNEITYNEICQPRFEDAFDRVIEFIKCARDIGLDTEVTTVTIPEINISKMKQLASELNVGFRVRQYYPSVW